MWITVVLWRCRAKPKESTETTNKTKCAVKRARVKSSAHSKLTLFFVSDAYWLLSMCATRTKINEIVCMYRRSGSLCACGCCMRAVYGVRRCALCLSISLYTNVYWVRASAFMTLPRRIQNYCLCIALFGVRSHMCLKTVAERRDSRATATHQLLIQTVWI